MEWTKQNHSWFFRFGSVISLIGGTVWFLWPADSWSVSPEALIALVSGTGLWLWQEAANFPSRRSHPHDIHLLRLVRSTVGPTQLDFLREHDLGGSFRQDAVSFLFNITDTWRGVRYEFQDRKLQARFTGFIEAARKLTHQIASRGYPVADGRLMSIIPDKERQQDWFSEDTRRMVTDLNAEATKLGQMYEDFERMARNRVPEAFQ